MAKETLSQHETEKLQTILGGLSSAQKDEMFELLKKDKRERKNQEKKLRKSGEMPKEDISVHKEEIMKYLSRLVEIEPNVEFMGHKGKKINIDLPAIGEFDGYKTTFFVSDHTFYEYGYETEIKNNKELVKKMCNEGVIFDLLFNLKKYIKELHKYIYKEEVNIDEHISYMSDEFDCYKGEDDFIRRVPKTDITDFLKPLGLLGRFYLQHEGVTVPERWSTYAYFYFEFDEKSRKKSGADLLLKMSD